MPDLRGSCTAGGSATPGIPLTRKKIIMRKFLTGSEPALILGVISAVLSLGTALGIPGLSAGQVALIVAAINAVFGVATAVVTRPIAPAVFLTLVSAVAALVAGYGLHVSPAVVGGVDALVLAGLALLTRAQVTPLAKLRPPVQAVRDV